MDRQGALIDLIKQKNGGDFVILKLSKLALQQYCHQTRMTTFS